MLKLLEEINTNREVARSSPATKMLPLQTEVWDTGQSAIRGMDPNLRRELESVYADIRLLNQLVWLSSEFHRSTRKMISEYTDLSLKIAKKLDAIVESPRSELRSE